MEVGAVSRKSKQTTEPIITTDSDTLTTDAFQNLMARIGFGSSNLLEGSDYPLTRISRDYNLMNSLYRSHWIVRKIIDTIPDDMCKNWIELTCQISPEMIDKYQKAERITRTRAGINEALKWGRLYGGSAALILIKGHENILDKPLDLDTVMPNSYCGLLVLDRWSGITPSAEQNQDINSPDFGLPESYRVTTETGKYYDVHASRVIRFIGRRLPFWERQAEVHWGCSEIEIVFDELKKRDNTSWNIASLIFLANIRVLKMGSLAQQLAATSAKAQQNLYNTLSAQNRLMCNMGMMVLDKDDDFDTKQYSFAGINDIYESFMLDMSGAAEIPCTKLFGRAPAGLNSTGDSDLQNYYDMLGEKQDSQLRPQLDKLIPVIALSTWGDIPNDLDFSFKPCQTVTSERRAELASKKTTSVVDCYNAGLVSQQIALKELRQMSDETGMWSNITDEDIEKADDSLESKGDIAAMGGIFGNKQPVKEDE